MINSRAIVNLGGGLNAVGAITLVNLVGVKRENLIFAEFVLNTQCQQNFIELSGECLLAGEEIIAGYLHGNGAAAGLNLASADQLRGGPQQAGNIHAGMLIKTIILGG